MHNSNNLVLFSFIFEIIIVFSRLNNKRKYFFYTLMYFYSFFKGMSVFLKLFYCYLNNLTFYNDR